MFEENIVIRANIASDLAPTQSPSSSIHQFALCHFGSNQSLCLVTISYSRDKLIVQDLSLINELSWTGQRDGSSSLQSRTTEGPSSNRTDCHELSNSRDKQTLYISTKDVINSLAVQQLRFKLANDSGQQASTSSFAAVAQKGTAPSQLDTNCTADYFTRDLLFIGCTNSLVIYDSFERTNLFNINTTTNITALIISSTHDDRLDGQQRKSQLRFNETESLDQLSWPTIFGGGVQKLYSFQVEQRLGNISTNGAPFGSFVSGSSIVSSLDKLIDIEISSERSISDTITCMCHGKINDLGIILTGSLEHKIKVYIVDTFDNNIQACKLTLKESARINCLQAINTVQLEPGDERLPINSTNINQARRRDPSQLEDYLVDSRSSSIAASLPSVNYSDNRSAQTTGDESNTTSEQMNCFAYGLENGFIGVYRLVSSSSSSNFASDTNRNENLASLFSERLWRHKSRQVPVSLVLYDINGDGLDELVIGYKNSRLEARSPLTGQLLAKTRCFRSEQLIGLALHETAQINRTLSRYQTHESTGSINQDQRVQKDLSLKQRDDATQGPAMLIACSTSTALLAHRPQRCQPRRPLIDYMSTARHNIGSADYPLRTLEETDKDEDWTSPLGFAMHSDYSKDIQTANTNAQAIIGGVEYKPDLHMIEKHDDDFTPIQCESRQNFELVQRISSLQNEQLILKQKINKIYFDKVQQISMLDLDSLTTSINLAHRWDFDSTTAKLRLTILVNNLVGYVEMFELVDKSCKFIKDGHLILKPNRQMANGEDESIDDKESMFMIDDDSNLIVLMLDSSADKNIEVRLNLRIYCLQLEVDNTRFNELVGPLKHHLMVHETLAYRVYERNVLVPRFSSFVPDSSSPPSVVALRSNAATNNDRLMRMAFRVNEHTSYLQILDWMRDNFLCFQFGQLISDHKESWWPATIAKSDLDANLTAQTNTDQQTDFALTKLFLEMNQEEPGEDNSHSQRHVPFDNSKNWSSGRMGDNGELELVLNLKDMRNLTELEILATDIEIGAMLGPVKLGNLTICYTWDKILSIECEDPDLMVDIVQSLVVECLDLSINDHSIVSEKDKLPKLDAIYDRLNIINDKTRQLEESERRIQTELYESADMTKNLMQQFTVSNQLNEYATSKELLNELSMMLNSAQNSAQAYDLNNRARLKLSKQANHLKEKIHFLLEC